jgi:hypothetical protein
MHRSVAVVAFAASLGLAVTASAQQSNPISFDTISKAKNGQWAEYTMSMKGQAQTIKMRYALVERGDKMLGLEVDSQTPMGPVVMHMQYSATGPEAWSMSKAVVQVGEQKKFMTAEEMKSGDIKKADLPGKLVGTETVTVPAGKFETKHYTRKTVMPGQPGEQQIDVWMSDKAPPTGLVKMTAANGVEAVLSGTGGDAKAKLSLDAKPEKSDKSDKSDKTEKSDKAATKPQK